MGEFVMPSLGADMEAGTLIAWKVKPGDRVKRGDIIGEVETEKGDIDIEVFEDGVVEQILVQPGEKVPVGAVLATIREAGIPAAGSLEKAPGERPPGEDGKMPERGVAPPEGKPRERVRASPLARRVAAELGIDLGGVAGTGPEGAIQRADVERAAAEVREAEKTPAPPEAAVPRVPAPLEGMRRAIAVAMAKSNREIPHYYLDTRIDMSRARAWLEAENQKRSVKERLLPAVLLIKAVARALGDVPELNGYWTNDRLVVQEAIHVGIAISLRQGGLMVPAVHHADLKSLDELMEALSNLILRTREGRLRSSELTDATITVTSLGDLGVETVYGVIYPPQVALVGFGKISEQPWAEDGMLGVRPVLKATLAADHRATDGHRGAQFLEAVRRYLQDPAML